MSRRDKERTKKLSFLKFCQDIYWDIVITYLLAHTAWEKYIKWTQSNDTNTLFRFYIYVPAWRILPFLQELPLCLLCFQYNQTNPLLSFLSPDPTWSHRQLSILHSSSSLNIPFLWYSLPCSLLFLSNCSACIEAILCKNVVQQYNSAIMARLFSLLLISYFLLML